VYAQDFAVTEKADASPLTQADLAAHRCIVSLLPDLDGGLPILSEESAHIDWPARRAWSRYWLVDPLDGTREFIKKNGEFTVNIALIDRGVPVLGAVYAPAMDWLLVGGHGIGARWQQGAQSGIARVAGAPHPLRVAASRSHRDITTQAYLDRIGSVDTVGLGSSVKSIFTRASDRPRNGILPPRRRFWKPPVAACSRLTGHPCATTARSRCSIHISSRSAICPSVGRIGCEHADRATAGNHAGPA
jgi:3'(2'), 5'-bisphosphate nucleotidase